MATLTQNDVFLRRACRELQRLELRARADAEVEGRKAMPHPIPQLNAVDPDTFASEYATNLEAVAADAQAQIDILLEVFGLDGE